MRSRWLSVALAFPALICAQTQDKVEPPVLETRVEPTYPPQSEIYVAVPTRINIVLDAKGVPFSLKPDDPIPDNVVRALAEWRFRPAKVNGQAHAYQVGYAVPIHRPLTAYASRSPRRWYESKEMKTAMERAQSLDSTGAAALAHSLNSNAKRMEDRLALIAWGKTTAGEDAAAAWAEQVLWLAQNDPHNDLLATPWALPPAHARAYEELRQVWVKALAGDKYDKETVAHATSFLRFSDPDLVIRTMQPLIGQTSSASEILGDVYGLAALGRTGPGATPNLATGSDTKLPETEFAQSARSTLTSTNDLRMLFEGLTTVADELRTMAKAGAVPASYTGFCGQLLARAQSYYPEVPERCASKPAPLVVSQLTVGGKVQAAKLTSSPQPVYPAEAKRAGITGTVEFKAVIGKDGKISRLEYNGGPLALYQAAYDAILRWVYQPTLLNGEPVMVTTTINVVFTFG